MGKNEILEIENCILLHCDVFASGTVTIPDGIRVIGKRAFLGCDQVTEIIIPEGVIRLDDSAIMHCEGLRQITLPSSLKVIGNYAFCVCKNLQKINFPQGLRQIGKEAFESTDLQSVSIPDSVIEIGEGAFRDNANLKKVKLSQNIRNIPKQLFKDCKSLMEIDIPERVDWFGDEAFAGCTNLKSIKLSSYAFDFGENVFEGCTNVTDIKLDRPTVSYLCENNVLYSRSRYKVLLGKKPTGDVKIPQGILQLDKSAFEKEQGITSLFIPRSINAIDELALAELSLNEINVDPDNKHYCSIDGVLYNYDKTLLIKYPTNKEAEVFDMPDSVKRISAYAFAGCKSLVNIAYSENLDTIGDHTFDGCTGFVNAVLPKSVQRIGEYAFANCTNLEMAYFHYETHDVKEHIFMGCTSLKYLYVPGHLMRPMIQKSGAPASAVIEKENPEEKEVKPFSIGEVMGIKKDPELEEIENEADNILDVDEYEEIVSTKLKNLLNDDNLDEERFEKFIRNNENIINKDNQCYFAEFIGSGRKIEEVTDSCTTATANKLLELYNKLNGKKIEDNFSTRILHIEEYYLLVSRRLREILNQDKLNDVKFRKFITEHERFIDNGYNRYMSNIALSGGEVEKVNEVCVNQIAEVLSGWW